MGNLIDARAVFPNAILPLAICNNCGRRVTKLPDNANIAQVACACGSVGNFVEPV